MAVSNDYRDYVLEQLGRPGRIIWRRMFGGIGLYCNGLFFAVMDNDTVYFKVDDSNRPDFEERGAGPFMPFGEGTQAMQYYEVPADVLEDRETLEKWTDRAVAVARAKSNRVTKRKVDVNLIAGVKQMANLKPKADLKSTANMNPKADLRPKAGPKPKADLRPKAGPKPQANLKPKADAEPTANLKPKSGMADEPSVSDEAVRSKTGKTWSEWFRILDKAGARKMSHKETASWLGDAHGVPSWWRQTITVTWERAMGLREKHQMANGYQISRSRTIPVPLSTLYACWNDDRKRARWLDTGLEIRNAVAHKSLRATLPDATRLEVIFQDKGGKKSQVVVQQSRIPTAAKAEKMKKYWSDRLEELKSLLETQRL
jgi:DNA transformation protein